MALDFESGSSTGLKSNSSACGFPAADAAFSYCWVCKIESFYDYGNIWGKGWEGGGGAAFCYYSSNGFPFVHNYSGTGLYIGAIAPPTGVWIFAALTRTGSTLRYFNIRYDTWAEINSTGTHNYLTSAGPEHSSIGCALSNSSGGSWDYFDGIVSWLAAYDAELSVDQLRAIAYLGPYCTRQPTSVFRLNHGTGTVAREQNGAGTMDFVGSPAWEQSGPGDLWLPRSIRRSFITIKGAGDQSATAGIANVTVSGLAPTAAPDTVSTAGLADVTVAGLAPSALYDLISTAGLADVTVAGLDPVATNDALVTAGVADVTVAGLAPSAVLSGVSKPVLFSKTMTGGFQ